MPSSTSRPVPVTPVRNRVPEAFVAHSARGRFNSAFFSLMGRYINWHMRKGKAKAFTDLPPTLVELGSRVGSKAVPANEA